MNDLERDLRELLHDDAHRVTTPSEAPNGLGASARRRQASVAALVGGTALALVAAIVAGATYLLPAERVVPAVEPVTSGTLNGITITYPRDWVLIDPDAAGLNGPDPTTVVVPRLILALAPTDPGDAFGCPGLAEGVGPAFLMTVQEEPLALTGAASAPWPVSLEPMDVGAAESGCYPGWGFQQAAWTAEGRTFEARVGLAPDVSDADRTALLHAFASMRFESPAGGTTSAVLASGTAGGQGWELIAGRQAGALTLDLQGETIGSGAGGYDASSKELQVTSAVFGEGEGAEMVIFGAVPTEVVRVEAVPAVGGPAASAETLDVPNEIDPTLDAFVMVLPPDTPIDLTAYDTDGNVVLNGSVTAQDEPVPTPVQEVPLEDGRHFGFVRSVDVSGRTIEFDLAYWLSGEEANHAYQEATGDTGPAPNDHFVVNDNPKLRTLPLSPELRLRLLDWNHCCDTFFDGDLALFAQAIQTQGDITDGDLIYRGQGQWWITVRDGVVTEIEEQYSP